MATPTRIGHTLIFHAKEKKTFAIDWRCWNCFRPRTISSREIKPTPNIDDDGGVTKVNFKMAMSINNITKRFCFNPGRIIFIRAYFELCRKTKWCLNLEARYNETNEHRTLCVIYPFAIHASTFDKWQWRNLARVECWSKRNEWYCANLSPTRILLILRLHNHLIYFIHFSNVSSTNVTKL